MSKPDGMPHGMSDFSFFPNARQQQSPTMAVPPGFMQNAGKVVRMQDNGPFRDQQQRGNGLQPSASSHVYQGLGSFSVPEDVHLSPNQPMKLPQDPQLMPHNCMPNYPQFSGTPRSHQNSQMSLNLQSQMQPPSLQNFGGRSPGEGHVPRMLTPVHRNDLNPLQFNQYHTPMMVNQSGLLANTSGHPGMAVSSGQWGTQQNQQYPGSTFAGRNGIAVAHPPTSAAAINHNPSESQPGKSSATTPTLPSAAGVQQQGYDPSGATGLKRRSCQTTASKVTKKRRGLGSQFMPTPFLPDSQQNEKAKGMCGDMQSRVGPILTSQAHLCPDTVRQTCMSLLSGVPAAVNMTLNSLSLLSFHGLSLPSADQTKLIAALCRVIDRSLSRRPPPMLLEDRKSPQVEKRFWWEEEEEGLIADLEQPLETVMWGICASNILRNLVISSQQGQLGNFSMVGARVLKCLDKRDGSYSLNEMALNMLETIQGMEGKVDPVGNKGDCTLLVEALIKYMRDNHTPLRLRTASAGAFASIARVVTHKEQVLKLGTSEELCLGDALSSLLQCSSGLSRKCAEEEANGELGYVDLVLPEPMNAHEIDLLSWRLQSEAISAAAKVCESLCELDKSWPTCVAAAQTSILRQLLKFASCEGPCSILTEQGGLQSSQHPFAICARNSQRRAERSAINTLSYIATSPAQCVCLIPLKYEILERAFSNTTYSAQLLRILTMIEEVCSTKFDAFLDL